jgi:hypothetical protein
MSSTDLRKTRHVCDEVFLTYLAETLAAYPQGGDLADHVRFGTMRAADLLRDIADCLEDDNRPEAAARYRAAAAAVTSLPHEVGAAD